MAILADVTLDIKHLHAPYADIRSDGERLSDSLVVVVSKIAQPVFRDKSFIVPEALPRVIARLMLNGYNGLVVKLAIVEVRGSLKV